MYALVRRSSAIAAALAALISGCGDDNHPTAPDGPSLLQIGSAADSPVEVTLYSEQSPTIGYARLTIGLRDADTGTIIDDAQVVLTPMMHMQHDDGSTMSHSAPQEAVIAGGDSLFTTATIFIMSGMWEMNVAFETESHSGTLSLDVEVGPGSHVQAISVGDERFFVTLIEPRSPRVGPNDLELCVHRRASMMSFPAVTDLDIDMDVSMPSMNHGSSGNVAPAAAAATDGHYHGTVNFTMTGDWHVDLALGESGEELLTTGFDMTVQ